MTRSWNIVMTRIMEHCDDTVMEHCTKINKWDLMKLKCFCTAKETINKMKRQPSELDKIIANNISSKGILSKINSSYNSTSKKQAPDWAKNLS